MRHNPSNPQVSLLRYEIREIVDFVQKLQELNPALVIENENIGDPVAKGWPIPPFLKDLIRTEIEIPGDKVFGYTHSRGHIETRKWITQYCKRFSPSVDLDYENVLITSGLGAGISALYHMLPKGLRILQPSPSYPTHASMESFAAGADPILYKLDPLNNWQPDLADMEAQIVAHPEVIGILLINPNNPTGAIYSKETLEKVIALAKAHGLMIFSDEIYFRLVYNDMNFVSITELAHEQVPLVVMRGLSKDVPWPGGRCGWLEFHGTHLDKDYKDYVDSVKKRVLMEVCSVTLPQFLLPKIYEHPDFETWLHSYNAHLEENSRIIAEILSGVKGLTVNRTNGAFYMMPIFEEGVLKPGQTLPIEHEGVRKFVEEKTANPDLPLDKRFVYYLLANTGICSVPASSFFSPHLGFRITTLDYHPDRLKEIYEKLARAIEGYLASC
ncbi:MAG: pyridoxal phosphate-dependent aminotransferase [Candidatus Gracilibacteria bacterium]|jgi:aspartate/methionine/tyrosine aminotransferase